MTIQDRAALRSRANRRTVLGASAAVVAMLAGALLGAGSASAAVPGVGVTAIVSSDAAGIPGAGAANGAAVSADGRYVAFTSESAFAGAPGGTAQVFRKDMSTGAIVLVSAGRDGSVATGAATQPSISADGRFVAFVSNATNLDPAHSSSILQVFVRDLAPGGVARLVTVNTTRTAGGDALSLLPSMAGDGRSVAFQSAASDLVPSAVSGNQVYRADISAAGTPAIELVSVQDPSVSPASAAADVDATTPASSYDGSVVAFASAAQNLTTDTPAAGVTQVFTRDRRTGTTTLVSAAAGAGIAGDRDSVDPSLSADGRTVAFASKATNIAVGPAGTTTTTAQIFVREPEKGRASRVVSMTFAGTGPANSNSSSPKLSADARRIVFASVATDLSDVANPNGVSQVFVRDLVRGVNSVVSVEAGTTPVVGSDFSGGPSMSADGRFVGFTSLAPRITPADPLGRTLVYLRGIAADGGPVGGSAIERVGGADRYEVSATVSAGRFAPGVPVAYVASGAVFADALSGSAAAGADRGPVLLTRKDAIPPLVAAELDRLDPARIVLLGGTATVAPAVQKALESFVGADPSRVTRIDGADRYEVSARVSGTVFTKGAQVAYIASGAVFPDALSGSAAAGLAKGPVLLVTRDTIPGAVSAELARLKPKSVVVLGGTSTVSEAVLKQIPPSMPATRLAGADRYEQSAAVAGASFPVAGGTVFVASGQVFPDALSGSAAAIRAKAPVLLVAADRIPPAVQTQLSRLKPTRIVVLGGEATVSAAVYESLRGYLAP
ncbi:cell wall-binding repeat-containing protein [Herbiconiux sp. CPCC 203407]|uniref:Cell wall-binding repeat-containing protein n=1 Tax=Herbiconiux oxytropis TaxID=2970915 RepID=A0AA41XGF6_9MICO|nr:cell wall-binding repeat-containing protein [Herbiconiux oxytropis]MCS5723745.1 cell wall-binding repeat-containing protein [Herbiconiux oxytropis]MCS5725245.1 cell wall-binding repeat-containing protein [Herbiconiux oxytropis]